MNFIDNLIKFFQAESIPHLIKIFIIFGITGTLSLFFSEFLLDNILIIKSISSYPLYLMLKLIFLLLVYQILLIIIALVFGEFKYFSKFTKKFLIRIKIMKS